MTGHAADRHPLDGAGRAGLDQLFGTSETAPPPFAKALPLKGFKGGKYYDNLAIARFHELTPEPVEAGTLSTFQAAVTRSGVEYYLGDAYDNTGVTYADRGKAANRYPIVYEGVDRAGRRYRAVLAGNHRCTAARLRGGQLLARIVRGSTTYPDGTVVHHPAVTGPGPTCADETAVMCVAPRLWVGQYPWPAPGHVMCATVDETYTAQETGAVAVVSDVETARSLLALRAVPAEQIDWLTMPTVSPLTDQELQAELSVRKNTAAPKRA